MISRCQVLVVREPPNWLGFLNPQRLFYFFLVFSKTFTEANRGRWRCLFGFSIVACLLVYLCEVTTDRLDEQLMTTANSNNVTLCRRMRVHLCECDRGGRLFIYIQRDWLTLPTRQLLLDGWISAAVHLISIGLLSIIRRGGCPC